jgi:hypothetical protein
MARSGRLKRLSICVGLLVAAIGILIANLNIFGGHILQRVPNSKGSVTAEVLESGIAAATDIDYLGVSLKARFNPFRHYVFGGANYGAQIQASWINDHLILIRCQHCENLQGGNILERKWRQVTICYDRSNTSDLPEEVDASCPKKAALATSEWHP